MRNDPRAQGGPRGGNVVLVPLLAAMSLIGGCEHQPVGPDPVPQATGRAAPMTAGASAAVTDSASGGGHFHNPAFGVDVQFAFTAVKRSASGHAVGNYHFMSVDGLSINIHGRVDCMTTDPENPGRAWMGGVITRNESEHPAFQGENSRVGKDAWFRVVDYGHGGSASQPDRTTMIFFEPAGGFTSAQQFCQAQLWFPEDRLTNPLSNGNIRVDR